MRACIEVRALKNIKALVRALILYSKGQSHQILRIKIFKYINNSQKYINYDTETKAQMTFSRERRGVDLGQSRWMYRFLIDVRVLVFGAIAMMYKYTPKHRVISLSSS